MLRLFRDSWPVARLAVDLGSARARVFLPNEGVVLDQPSVVALGSGRRPRVEAYGDAAQRLLPGRPGASVRPLRVVEAGAVADIGAAAAFLKAILRETGHRRGFARGPALVMAAPAGSSAVDRDALQSAAIGAGASEVHLFEQPLAAAIGAGLEVAEQQARLVAVVGAGTSEVAVMADGTIIDSQSIATGGDDLNRAIVACVLRAHSVLIDEAAADRLKRALGVARAADAGDETLTVAGVDAARQTPTEVTVAQRDIARALNALVSALADALLLPLARVGPDRAAEVMEGGLTLTGGGALLNGLSDLLQSATGMPVVVAEAPGLSVIRGLGLVVEETPDLRLLDA